MRLREAAAPHAHEQVERHGERRGLVQDDLLELGELPHLVRVRVGVRARATVRVRVRVRMISCLLYTSPSPRDATLSRMPSSA